MGLFDRFKKKTDYTKFKCRDFAKEFKKDYENETKIISDMSSFLSAWEKTCCDANCMYAKIISNSTELTDEEMLNLYFDAHKVNPHDYSLEEWFRFIVKGTIAVKKGESTSDFKKNLEDENYHAYDSIIPKEDENVDLDDGNDENAEKTSITNSDLDDVQTTKIIDIPLDRSDFINENFNIDEMADDYSNAKNFKYFDDLINSGITKVCLDYDIVLGKDEESIYASGLTFNGNVEIDGNDYVIDCLGKNCLFDIESEEIVFKNITFKNLCADGPSNIINNSKSATFENCTFYNCVIGENGLIANNEGKSINLISCDFENIFGTMRGAIVNNSGNINLEECNFDNCKSNMGSSITNILGNAIIKDCNFSNCLTDGNGGVILNRAGILEIKSSNFDNNSSKYGGAIFNENNMTVEDCNFDNNSSKLEGGHILNRGSDISISNSNFNEGAADMSGGAIFNYKSMKINDCIFENCYSKLGGGIVNVEKMDADLCIFESNKGTDGGGAIFNHDTGEIVFKECNFEKNTSNLGGGIDNRGQVSFYECIFEKNEGTEVGGGAVLNHGKVILDGCDFEENYGKLAAGAIFMGRGEINISNCNFNGNRNNSIQGSSTIFIADFKCEMKNCNFTNNNGIGIETVFDDGAGTIDGCIFENGVKNQLMITNAEVTIKSCTFDSDYSISNSGTIKVSSDEKNNMNNIISGGNVEII